jgi:hypothetical protein
MFFLPSVLYLFLPLPFCLPFWLMVHLIVLESTYFIMIIIIMMMIMTMFIIIITGNPPLLV